MKIKTDLPVGYTETGFTTSNDLFNKKDLALRLTSLFQGLEHGSVSLLDGRWGIGKSTFVKQWIAHLKSENIPAIYFDAFESDFIESAFQAIAGTFVRAATDAKRNEQPAYRNFLNQAAKVGRTLAASTAKLGVKAATLGLIGTSEIEDLKEISGDVADAFGGWTESGVSELLESHSRHASEFSALRDSLLALPNLLQPTQDISKSGSVPLVVVIDELDRCRPDFALGVLETLKHFFKTERLHFVLVTNSSHLELSVAHKYGNGTAAREYLQKFYDFVIFFDQNSAGGEAANSRRYISYLAETLLPKDVEGIQYIEENLKTISKAFDLSLRQIDSIFTNVALSFLAVRPNEYRNTFLIPFLALMKKISPELYRKAKMGTLSYAEISKFLSDGSLDWGDFDVARVLKVFQFHLDKNINDRSDEWAGYGRELFTLNLGRTDVIRYLANNVMDRFGGVPNS